MSVKRNRALAASALVGGSVILAASSLTQCPGSTPPTTTTVEATTTVEPTTTTVAPAPLTCTAFNDPTNTFHLNNVYGDPNLINVEKPVFTLAADGAAASYTVKIDGATWDGTFHNYTSSTVCIQSPALDDGPHTISAVELAPNARDVPAYTFIVDTVKPAPPVITTASYVAPYVRIAGTGISTLAVRVYETETLRGGGSVGVTGLWSAAFSRPSGTHEFYAMQTDRAGNVSLASNVVSVIVP